MPKSKCLGFSSFCFAGEKIHIGSVGDRPAADLTRYARPIGMNTRSGLRHLNSEINTGEFNVEGRARSVRLCGAQSVEGIQSVCAGTAL